MDLAEKHVMKALKASTSSLQYCHDLSSLQDLLRKLINIRQPVFNIPTFDVCQSETIDTFTLRLFRPISMAALHLCLDTLHSWDLNLIYFALKSHSDNARRVKKPVKVLYLKEFIYFTYSFGIPDIFKKHGVLKSDVLRNIVDILYIFHLMSNTLQPISSAVTSSI